MMVCEFARNVAGMPEANTTEADQRTPFPVISLLSEQRGVEDLGGTMRLGGYDCRLVEGTHAAAAYGQEACAGAAPPPLGGQQRLVASP